MTIIVRSSEAQNMLRKMPDTVFKQTKKAITRATFNTHSIIVENATTKLKVRTGRLRQSLTPRVQGKKIADLVGSVSTNVIYAPLHEFGKTIRPVNNKYKKVPGGPYINIPLRANKTPAGVMRQTARQVFNGGGFIAQNKTTKKWYVLNRDGQAMFILKKFSKIVPRLGMFKAQKDVTPALLDDLDNILLGL